MNVHYIYITYVRVTEIEVVMYLKMILPPQLVAVHSSQYLFHLQLCMYRMIFSKERIPQRIPTVALKEFLNEIERKSTKSTIRYYFTFSQSAVAKAFRLL